MILNIVDESVLISLMQKKLQAIVRSLGRTTTGRFASNKLREKAYTDSIKLFLFLCKQCSFTVKRGKFAFTTPPLKLASLQLKIFHILDPGFLNVLGLLDLWKEKALWQIYQQLYLWSFTISAQFSIARMLLLRNGVLHQCVSFSSGKLEFSQVHQLLGYCCRLQFVTILR